MDDNNIIRAQSMTDNDISNLNQFLMETGIDSSVSVSMDETNDLYIVVTRDENEQSNVQRLLQYFAGAGFKELKDESIY